MRKINKDGTIMANKDVLDPGAIKMVNADQTKALELTTEGIGGFLNAVRMRRLSSKTHKEYQNWVEGLCTTRKALLSCYEIGYIHGTKDEQEKHGLLHINPLRAN